MSGWSERLENPEDVSPAILGKGIFPQILFLLFLMYWVCFSSALSVVLTVEDLVFPRRFSSIFIRLVISSNVSGPGILGF